MVADHRTATLSRAPKVSSTVTFTSGNAPRIRSTKRIKSAGPRILAPGSLAHSHSILGQQFFDRRNLPLIPHFLKPATHQSHVRFGSHEFSSPEAFNRKLQG